MAVIRQFQASSFIRLWLHGGPRRVLLCVIPLRKTHILQYEVSRGQLAGFYGLWVYKDDENSVVEYLTAVRSTIHLGKKDLDLPDVCKSSDDLGAGVG